MEHKAGIQFSAQGETSWGSRLLVRIKNFFGKDFGIDEQKITALLDFRASSSSHPTAKIPGSRSFQPPISGLHAHEVHP